MLQIADLSTYNEANVGKLLELINPVLLKRKELHGKYSRYGSDVKLMYADNKDITKLPYEKFITDLATGYLSGKPSYKVNVSNDTKRNEILTKLLDVKAKDNDYQTEMEILIDFISNYNDDEQELHDLVHDCLELTSCYELIYENEQNEIVYSRLDPLQTVATWDYSVPANLTGLVRRWMERDLEGNLITKVELIDKESTRLYSSYGNYTKLEQVTPHYWGDVPGFAVETPFAIFEPCEDVIGAIEQLLQNIRNTYQYNDRDCKLKIVGFAPQNEITTLNDKGEVVYNPARKIEDEAILNAKTFYIPEAGDVSYITKPLDSAGAIEMFKMYIDLMFQLSGIPNTNDLAFDSADLNASAIDRKFYIMNMCTEKVVSLLKKALLRRWELVFNHINIKKSTNYDFRNISVDIPKDLPSNTSEMADFYLKLKDMISDQTIVESLGFNFASEKSKMDDEATDNMQMNLERLKALGETNEQSEDNTTTLEDNRQGTQEDTSED